MKYIITENKLNKVIFKYLDSQYGALKQKKGKLWTIWLKMVLVLVKLT